MSDPPAALPALLELLRAKSAKLAGLTTRHATLEDVFVSSTYAGSSPLEILVGFTAAEGAPIDETDVLTLNFKHVKWERTDCTPRTVAAR